MWDLYGNCVGKCGGEVFFAPKGVFWGRKFFRILSLEGFEMWIFDFGVIGA